MTDLYGFELLQERYVPELDVNARLFRHLKTGAQLLSIENTDENKVFGITFRTPPSNSTGVAHILEHAVLCGSRKYPLKEPFVELIKGSLQTFLNAFTFPDKTCYPLASQNVQDFYNLIDVYLDAVFYPQLTPFTFQQEGWHYELTDPDTPLSLKGIVFNEMKGAYGSPDSVLNEYVQQSLFPDTCYSVDSGGHPQVIPDLTYEQFIAFHRAYYHPTNARFFFYGDDNPTERLRFLNAYLNTFERLEVRSSVQLQPRFTEPRTISCAYATNQQSSAHQAMLTVNWLLDEARDPEMTLALQVLAYILIGMPASPLRKTLIDSNLGEDLAGPGIADSLRQHYFSTGLKGIAHEQADAVAELIQRTLRQLAEEGIDPQTVEAALNTIEFRLRENNTGAFPRGLALMLRALSTWLYDGDPITPLAFEAPLKMIKQRLQAGEPYFEQLIRRFFLQNQHRTTLILEPDPELSQREAALEQERLAQYRATLSAADLLTIIENTRTLKQLQETPDPPERLAILPRLKLADLDQQSQIIPLEVRELHGARVLYHNLFTNGIIYLDIGLNLQALPQELLPYVQLFGRALQEMGTAQEDFVQFSQRIGRKTGGIIAQPFTSVIRETQASTAWLFLRSKAVSSQADELLAILRDMLLTARLDDKERFRQIVLEEKSNQEAMLIPRGHSFVNARLRAHFNQADWAGEQLSGVSFLFFLRQLAQDIDTSWPAVQAKLEQVRDRLLNRNTMLCNVTLDQANWERVAPALDDLLATLPATSPQTASWSPQPQPRFEGLSIPSQVNYVGKASNLYQLGYRPHGAATVIVKYLRTTWLWERVRVQGGAYGGFCFFDHRSGVLSFLSYRDPNLLATLDIYDQTSRFLRERQLNDDELTRSIIGTIGDLDAYQLPDAKGYLSMIRYLIGDTDEIRQRMRDEVLACTVADFASFAAVLERITQSDPVVVLGSQAAIEAANTVRPGWLDVRKLL